MTLAAVCPLDHRCKRLLRIDLDREAGPESFLKQALDGVCEKSWPHGDRINYLG